MTKFINNIFFETLNFTWTGVFGRRIQNKMVLFNLSKFILSRFYSAMFYFEALGIHRYTRAQKFKKMQNTFPCLKIIKIFC